VEQGGSLSWGEYVEAEDEVVHAVRDSGWPIYGLTTPWPGGRAYGADMVNGNLNSVSLGYILSDELNGPSIVVHTFMESDSETIAILSVIAGIHRDTPGQPITAGLEHATRLELEIVLREEGRQALGYKAHDAWIVGSRAPDAYLYVEGHEIDPLDFAAEHRVGVIQDIEPYITGRRELMKRWWAS
jgi:hypothetical protein